MPLRTRPPTGQVAWPLLLVEGEDHAGKSYASYSLSADPRVGRTFVIDLGEGSADEYAALGPYEVVEHNGTYADLLGQVEAAAAEPTPDSRPNIIVLDTGTDLWELLKRWAEQRARSSRANRRKLAEDPEAEVDIPMNIWNDVAERWYRVLNAMRRANTIGVIICRGKEVAKVQGGQPVAGETEYRVEAHKGTPYAVTAQVRFTRPHVATLVSARSLTFDVPSGGLVLPDDGALAHLIFDVLGAGEHSVPANIVRSQLGLERGEAKRLLMERAGELGSARPRDHAAEAWTATVGADGGPPEVTPEQWESILSHLADAVAADNSPPAADESAQDAPVASGGSDTPPEAPAGDEAPTSDRIADFLARPSERRADPEQAPGMAELIAMHEATVAGMSLAAVQTDLTDYQLATDGGAQACRKRLVDHLVKTDIEGTST